MNFLNPNPWIFWSLVTGPILIHAWDESPGKGVAFLAGFYGAMIVCLALIIILFGTARQLGPRVSRAALGMSAVALAGFGIFQIVKSIFCAMNTLYKDLTKNKHLARMRFAEIRRHASINREGEE